MTEQEKEDKFPYPICFENNQKLGHLEEKLRFLENHVSEIRQEGLSKKGRFAVYSTAITVMADVAIRLIDKLL